MEKPPKTHGEIADELFESWFEQQEMMKMNFMLLLPEVARTYKQLMKLGFREGYMRGPTFL